MIRRLLAYDVDTERGMVVAEREKKVTARYIKTRDALAAYGDDGPFGGQRPGH